MELGQRQKLCVKRKTDHGMYLSDEDGNEVLLPKKQTHGLKIGEKVIAFVYKDSEDRIISTLEEPFIEMGEPAVLSVKAVSEIGAFLDWGLDKDLFLPFKQQTKKVNPGDEVLVYLYLDKTQRLCASMKVYHELSTDHDYHVDDIVNGRVYEVSQRFGAYVAVDDIYSGMVSPTEDISSLSPGDIKRFRIYRIKEDGKLDLTLRQKAYLQMDDDAEKILSLLDMYEGTLPVGEKDSPEKIKEETGLSKNAFKRALGRLYKKRKITIDGDGRVSLA